MTIPDLQTTGPEAAQSSMFYLSGLEAVIGVRTVIERRLVLRESGKGSGGVTLQRLLEFLLEECNMGKPNSLRLSIALFLLLTAPFSASFAQAKWALCKPTETMIFAGRIHVKCAFPVGKFWYFAVSTQDTHFASRVFGLGAVAQVAEKTLSILYDAGDISGEAFGCQPNDCRTAIAIGMTEETAPLHQVVDQLLVSIDPVPTNRTDIEVTVRAEDAQTHQSVKGQVLMGQNQEWKGDTGTPFHGVFCQKGGYEGELIPEWISVIAPNYSQAFVNFQCSNGGRTLVVSISPLPKTEKKSKATVHAEDYETHLPVKGTVLVDDQPKGDTNVELNTEFCTTLSKYAIPEMGLKAKQVAVSATGYAEATVNFTCEQ
jgi:hypothetical protein